MPSRKLPPNDELFKMLRSGMTHQQIADKVSAELGQKVTRAAVTLALGRAGHQPSNPRYSNEIPWVVGQEHIIEWPVRMLRLLGKRNAGATPLTEAEQGQLQRWLSLLHSNNAVVAYCPTAIPGFYYVVADESGDEPNGIPIRPRLLSRSEVEDQ